MACVIRDADARYQIGTSGYMVGRGKWTKLPCLNCIEINSSFYRIPSQKFIASLHRLPPNVNIVMKAWKYLTHVKRLKDPEEGWNPFWEAIQSLGPRLAGVLVQLPPSFAKTDVNVQRILALHNIIPAGVRIAVEFRHASWLDKDTYELFSRLRWAVVGTYIVKGPTSKWVGTMPPGLYIPPATSTFNYLRVHGKKGWKGELSERELLLIRRSLGQQRVTTSFVMFNNSFFTKRSDSCLVNDQKLGSAAVCNAVEFAGLVRRRPTRRLSLPTRARGARSRRKHRRKK